MNTNMRPPIARLFPGPRMSQGVVYGGLLYTAGQVDDASADVSAQTKNVLAKIDALLSSAGSSREHLISANVWLADMSTFDEMNAVWEDWIDKDNPPARATVGSRLATPAYKVEVSIIAAVPSK